MREILFRGKQIDNGEWVEGYFTKGIPIYAGVTPDVEPDLCQIKTRGHTFRVETETVGQFTGLCDKNGNKIFEGDVVKIDDKYIDNVVYSNGCFCMDKQIFNYEFTYQDFNCIEVIGNVFDNPDLIGDVNK